MENVLKIEIFGERHKFKTNLEPDQAEAVVELLLNEISRVQNCQGEKSSGINNVAIMIIAALNIAKENFEMKNQNSAIVHQISSRSDKLIKNLDLCLKREKQGTYLNRICIPGTSEVAVENRDRKKAGSY